MLISKYDSHNIEEKIGEIESEFNIKLSQDYVQFLLKYNGGDTPKTSIRFGKIKTDIRRFYGFTARGEYTDLQTFLHSELGECLILDCKLPIATNAFGDYFVISVSEKNNGEISFIYHEQSKNECRVAPSFREFISLCVSEKIGHIRSIEERKQSFISAGNGYKITQIKLDCWQKEIDKYAGMQQEKVIL